MTGGGANAAAPGRVQGRVALVTGAASGIGRATALALAREGAIVMATDRDPGGAERCAAAIRAAGRLGLAAPLDVTSEENWRAIIDALVKQWGSLDILVNNAAVAVAMPLEAMSLDVWRTVMAVNLDGVFLGTRQGVIAMRRGQGGSIINMSSASSRRPSPGVSAYGASKAAVSLFSKVVALECAARGDRIRVNCVLPGAVHAPIWERVVAPTAAAAAAAGPAPDGEPSTPPRIATPDEVAQAILYLASDESRDVTGADFAIDGGLTA
ncbi:MAG: SDR family NAD(P)-dependent oxidoreductase [Candidatus Krumholzibacteriia bacterium]